MKIVIVSYINLRCSKTDSATMWNPCPQWYAPPNMVLEHGKNMEQMYMCYNVHVPLANIDTAEKSARRFSLGTKKIWQTWHKLVYNHHNYRRTNVQRVRLVASACSPLQLSGPPCEVPMGTKQKCEAPMPEIIRLTCPATQKKGRCASGNVLCIQFKKRSLGKIFIELGNGLLTNQNYLEGDHIVGAMFKYRYHGNPCNRYIESLLMAAAAHIQRCCAPPANFMENFAKTGQKRYSTSDMI